MWVPCTKGLPGGRPGRPSQNPGDHRGVCTWPWGQSKGPLAGPGLWPGKFRAPPLTGAPPHYLRVQVKGDHHTEQWDLLQAGQRGLGAGPRHPRLIFWGYLAKLSPPPPPPQWLGLAEARASRRSGLFWPV